LETYRVFLKCAIHTETIETDLMSMDDLSLQRIKSAGDELKDLVGDTISELVK
jgi:hypothetical protein